MDTSDGYLSDEEMEIFELAFILKIPVYKLVEEMPYEEFVGWLDYFKRRPVGWREDNRTSYLLMSSGATINPETIFPSLRAIRSTSNSKTVVNTLKESTMFHLMQNAVGDGIAFLEDA